MCFYNFFLLNSQSIGLGLGIKIKWLKLGLKKCNEDISSLLYFPKQANRYIHRSAVSQCYERRPERTKQNQKTTLIGIFNML